MFYYFLSGKPRKVDFLESNKHKHDINKCVLNEIENCNKNLLQCEILVTCVGILIRNDIVVRIPSIIAFYSQRECY